MSLLETPVHTHFLSSYTTYNPNMSNAASLEYEADDCQFEHILSQLEQQWPIREQVSRALKEANAAFASQFTQPDGYTYMQTCDELSRFLNIKVPLEYTEQKQVVQVLQVACAMHENAVNNPKLTPTERSAHHLATTSLLPLCESALENNITYTDLWCEVLDLAGRVRQAHARATDALDLSKYLNFDNIKDDHSGSGAYETQTTLSSAPGPSKPAPTPSNAATPRRSVHDTSPDSCLTSRSTKLKDKALAMLNDQSYKAAPLGRRHTMPTLLQTAPGPYPTRTSAGRTSSKAHSRGRGLNAVQEAEE